ncbi:family 43 glycosylhydrolase [Nocardia sp. alder85J]|uniref:family 43 glycosylhydrolase n=1 Tax=Nocardia sp. alder85J TaxID=2862949 RepID=UPI001CD77097|nr:family 43 glycosylhydrolase [Nocardia sp. alder85J]MCX4097459.1 family 43 glycosylhydrolase [Nocardia sp. alder85J]
MRVSAGPFRHLYDPSAGRAESWYINDHTLVRDATGRWHLFGITHPEPADPWHEIEFAHATAERLHGPWTTRPAALRTDPSRGETHLWAPHVIARDGTYFMFYDGGGPDRTATAMCLATSTDLFHWTRHPHGPLFRDGYDARDPMVCRIGDRWVMFYCATDDPAGGRHIVAYRTSADLVRWSDRGIAWTDTATGTGAGPTESPFVLRHNDFWYLFIGPRPDYVGTEVFRSADPLHFERAGRAGHIAAHAAEIVRDDDGSRWITSAGWGRGGVWLAPLLFGD